MKKLFICKYCNKVLIGDSPKCFHCGRDQRSFIKRYRAHILSSSMLLGLIVFVILLGKL